MDKAILDNLHTFNGIAYSVEKVLNSAARTIDTFTPTSSASGMFLMFSIEHSVALLRLKTKDHTVFYEIELANDS